MCSVFICTALIQALEEGILGLICGWESFSLCIKVSTTGYPVQQQQKFQSLRALIEFTIVHYKSRQRSTNKSTQQMQYADILKQNVG
jgi:hypothetical protein